MTNTSYIKNDFIRVDKWFENVFIDLRTYIQYDNFTWKQYGQFTNLMSQSLTSKHF